jgi:hypothetical protein
VTKAASSDELFGSFAEATFVTALRLFTGLNIQGRKGHAETDVGSHQISKQVLFLPLITETPTALRDLVLSTNLD